MTPDQFVRWLEGVKLTAPFTLADASELKAMIKTAVPDASVDIHAPHGDKVFVRVATERGEIERVIDVG